LKQTVLTAAAALTMMLSAGASDAATISTLSRELSRTGPWGLPSVAAFGQTFTLDQTSTLKDVTFRIDDGGTAINFISYVFGWDASNVRTTGSALAAVSGSTGRSATMRSVSIGLGDITVGAGQYVAFFQATSVGRASVGFTGGNVYDGGDFVFQDNLGDESLFNTGWRILNASGTDFDTAFEITYEPVAPIPLPGALPLMLAGLGALGIAARRRRGVGAPR
jgi:hypothetical protein